MKNFTKTAQTSKKVIKPTERSMVLKMNTKIVPLTQDEDKETLFAKLTQAGEAIRNGGLVAFPTETVYGLGGDALNPKSSQKIYEAKGRPSDNPLIVHIADMEHLEKLCKTCPKTPKNLQTHFGPDRLP